MTTAAAVSPPRIAEVRGRALGVTLLAFFALAWVGWGTGGHLATIPQAILVILAALLSVALTMYAWRLPRRMPSDPEVADNTPDGGGSTSRSFGLIVAAEWIGLFVIAGTLGAWLGGKLDDSLGPKRVIAGSLLILLFAIVAILLVDKDSIFFVKVAPPTPGGALFSGAAERAYLVLGCLIGAAGGPLQAASRTLLIRLAPKDRIAQYFGLFALTGKVTSFIGPLLIGVVTAITASQKAGMAVLVLFFVAGLALLARVRED